MGVEQVLSRLAINLVQERLMMTISILIRTHLTKGMGSLLSFAI